MMPDLELLAYALAQFAGLSAEAFALSVPMWQRKSFGKGESFNQQGSICRYLGFIHAGVFRSYVVDAKTLQERNFFLYTQHQFVVPFKSFVSQVPCHYHTQAMTDASLLVISHDDLLALYGQSHEWERFGRLMAQEAFSVTIERMEGLLLKSPEERYLDLVKNHPDIFNSIPLYHISSYLGIQGPSLSRIRRRLSGRPHDLNPG